jgi:small subunit ribosomal protein S17
MTEKKSIFDRKRKMVGIVVSTKNTNTIKVAIDKFKYHAIYKKRIKLTKNILVNDTKNEAKVGDKVQVIESRPISKLKRWQLVKIVEKAK